MYGSLGVGILYAMWCVYKLVQGWAGVGHGKQAPRQSKVSARPLLPGVELDDSARDVVDHLLLLFPTLRRLIHEDLHRRKTNDGCFNRTSEQLSETNQRATHRRTDVLTFRRSDVETYTHDNTSAEATTQQPQHAQR